MQYNDFHFYMLSFSENNYKLRFLANKSLVASLKLETSELVNTGSEASAKFVLCKSVLMST